MVQPTPACFHLLNNENIAHLVRKLDSPILVEKNRSWCRQGKINDLGLKKKHHRMTPIEHFLLDIIQILFRDWIENTITDIGRCKVATDIFLPTFDNFFYKRWPIKFFYDRGCFLFGVAIKIYNVRRLGFFVRAQPKLWFDRHWHVFIRSAMKTLAHLGIKLDSPILIQKNASRRGRGKINDRGLKKKHYRMTPIKHFLLDIIQI